MTRKRMFIFHCPVCRQWMPCPTATVWETAKAKRVCRECVASNYGRLRYHIAFLEDALLDTNGKPGGRLKRHADAQPERREAYRALYRKRQGQLQQAQAQLKALVAGHRVEAVAR